LRSDLGAFSSFLTLFSLLELTTNSTTNRLIFVDDKPSILPQLLHAGGGKGGGEGGGGGGDEASVRIKVDESDGGASSFPFNPSPLWHNLSAGSSFSSPSSSERHRLTRRRRPSSSSPPSFNLHRTVKKQKKRKPKAVKAVKVLGWSERSLVEEGEGDEWGCVKRFFRRFSFFFSLCIFFTADRHS
jgi:hypothetical protein